LIPRVIRFRGSLEQRLHISELLCSLTESLFGVLHVWLITRLYWDCGWLAETGTETFLLTALSGVILHRRAASNITLSPAISSLQARESRLACITSSFGVLPSHIDILPESRPDLRLILQLRRAKPPKIETAAPISAANPLLRCAPRKILEVY
jgi:hypothetical protein